MGGYSRGVYAVIAFGALAAGLLTDPNPVREASAAATGAACLGVLAVSVAQRSAGVRGQRLEHDRRSARVAAMTGFDRAESARPSGEVRRGPRTTAEFDPRLDLVPVVVGTVGLLAAAVDADGEVALSVLRTLVGAAFLGSITDAMLLGHWYLVQPGLPRRLLDELVDAVAVIWPIEVVALLIPTGMLECVVGVDRRRLGRNARLDVGGVCRDDDRPRLRHQGGAQGAAVLGRDGGDRSAVPGDPHRLRNGHRRSRRAVAVTIARGEAEFAVNSRDDVEP